jgi:hypothetical protein
MSENTPIVFGAEEHVGLIGKTRSGKTTWAKALIIPAYGRIGTIDSKTPMRPDGKTDFPDIPVCTPDQYVRAMSDPRGHFNWRMKWKVGAEGVAAADRLCYQLLEKGTRGATYWDEVTDFCDAGRIPDGMLELIRKGGGLNLNQIWGTQRPQLVNRSIWNNTHHLFAFYVDPYDAKVAEPYFPELKANLHLIPYGSHKCLYKGPDGSVMVLGAVQL